MVVINTSTASQSLFSSQMPVLQLQLTPWSQVAIHSSRDGFRDDNLVCFII